MDTLIETVASFHRKQQNMDKKKLNMEEKFCHNLLFLMLF